MATINDFGTETGCVFDSHHGIHIPQMICELAVAYGWEHSWQEWEDHNDDNHDVYELCDEATDWLNRNVAHVGYSFGWWESAYYYWSENDWEEAFSF